MKTIIIRVCHMNRPFGLYPVITTKTFHDKQKADKYAKKFENHPNKFIFARFEDGKEIDV